jgi:hypothetical protein
MFDFSTDIILGICFLKHDVGIVPQEIADVNPCGAGAMQ